MSSRVAFIAVVSICSLSMSFSFNSSGDGGRDFTNPILFLCKSLDGGSPVVQLYRSPGGESDNNQTALIASRNLSIENGQLPLRVEARGAMYAFSFGERPGAWNLLKDSVDARFLSTRVAGGFVGCIFAL